MTNIKHIVLLLSQLSFYRLRWYMLHQLALIVSFQKPFPYINSFTSNFKNYWRMTWTIAIFKFNMRYCMNMRVILICKKGEINIWNRYSDFTDNALLGSMMVSFIWTNQCKDWAIFWSDTLRNCTQPKQVYSLRWHTINFALPWINFTQNVNS